MKITNKQQTNMKMKLTELACGFSLLGAVVNASAAPDLALNLSGDFNAATTLNGAPLGADTPFTLQAVFNTPGTPFLLAGVYAFSVTDISLQLGGLSYTVASPASCFLYLADPSARAPYSYGVALTQDFDNAELLMYFSGSTPAFSSSSPTPALLTGLDYAGSVGDNLFTFSRNGGADTVVVDDFGSEPFTAELSAVPEPSQWAAISFGVLGLVYVAKRRFMPAQ